MLNVQTRNKMNVSKEILNQTLLLSLDGDLIGESNGVEILGIVNDSLSTTINSIHEFQWGRSVNYNFNKSKYE